MTNCKYVKDDSREQKRLMKLINTMTKTPHVAVGVLQDEKVGPGFSMVDLALVHEYGSRNGHIPARSFFRSTLDAQAHKHINLMKRLHAQVLKGRLTLKQALQALGEVVTKDIVQTINRGVRPELKASTVKRKKSSKALIDTGRLKGSITHEVRGVS